MPTLNLSKETLKIDTTLDHVVIVQMIECAPLGGRVLDVEGFKPETIRAGHVIIRSQEGVYKPMPVNSAGTAYDSLPGSHTIVGVCYASIRRSKPSATIMVRGSVNEVASPYPVTEEIKTALPLIRFTQD